MMLIYPAVFHTENNSVWAEFPDLEGCQTFGENLEECIMYAQEALELYAQSVIERKTKLNKATDVKNIKLTDSDSFVMPIYCELKYNEKEEKAVKKTLTIPYWLNERALNCGVNFSEVLKNALIEKLYK